MIIKGSPYKPTLKSVEAAANSLKEITAVTPLLKNETYSEKFDSNIFLKIVLPDVREYSLLFRKIGIYFRC